MASAADLAPDAKEATFLDTLASVRASHPDNLSARYLTPALFRGYDEEQRARLMACCRSGVENPDSIIGCYLLQPDDLTDLRAFFDPLIRDRHAPPPRDDGAARPPLAPGGLRARVRVARNLAGYDLPARMDRSGRLRLEQGLTRALAPLVDDPAFGGRLISLAAQAERSADADLLPRPMDADPYMRSAGLAGDWPCGRVAYVSADRSLIVWIGEEDHLRVIGLTTADGLDSTTARVRGVLEVLEAALGVSFLRDATYGFVTSCPSNLGSGFKPSVRMGAGKLLRAGLDAPSLHRQFGLAASGPAGDRSGLVSDGPVDLAPIRRWGVDDRQMIEDLRRGLARVWAAIEG